MRQYKLRTATLGLCQQTGRHVVITIPCGTILRVIDDSADKNGLLEAEWMGNNVHIFAADLLSRGELVRARRV
jgi:hypothetical protein